MDNSTYQKNKGYAGDEGVKFQVGLLTVFLLNALRSLKDWRISTENEEAGKFDDIAIEMSDRSAVLLQAKQRKNQKDITLNDIVSKNIKNDDFSLAKYFLSYQDIKDKFKVKNIIICTNSKMHSNILKFVKRQKIYKESMLHHSESNYSLYTFNDDILPHLKKAIANYYKAKTKKDIEEETITNVNMKEFLKRLQFYSNYPNGNKLDLVIEQLLFSLKDLSSSCSEATSQDVQNKVKDWYDQPRGVYLTEARARAMFCEIHSDKYCEKLERYNIFFERNDFIYTDTMRVFQVIAEDGYLLCVLKIYRDFHIIKKKILIVNLDDDIVVQKRVIETFEMPQYTYLIIINPKTADEAVVSEIFATLNTVLDRHEKKKVIWVTDCKNDLSFQIESIHKSYAAIKKSYRFKNLSNDTQDRLLKKKNIVFQGRDVSLEELFNVREIESFIKGLSTEVLEKLIRDEKIKVGVPPTDLDTDTRRYYIRRTFNRETVKVEEEDIYDVDEKMLLISDSAGMGKSTVLTKLAVVIKKKYPHLWVIRIELNEYTKILRDALRRKQETVDIMELLDSKNATKLTNYLEKFIFTMDKKVVLILDAVDEVSPDYTEIISNILIQCLDASNLAKVFVSTRPHITPELELSLDVKTFMLVPFTKENQIDFLTRYWTHNLQLHNSTVNNKNKCVQYAEALIGKMLCWVKLDSRIGSHFAAIPLQVRMLAEIFQENIRQKEATDWEGCKEYLKRNDREPRLPEKMDIRKLYEIFIEKKRNIFIDKGNPTGNPDASRALAKQFDDCLAQHRTLALKLILGKPKCERFSCYHKENDPHMETNALKIGMVQKLDTAFHFIHRTFAEYFVAQSVLMELQLSKQSVEFQKIFVHELLWNSEFRVVRAFLDNFLHRYGDHLPANIYHNFQSLTYKTFNFIHQLTREDCLAILQLVFKCIDVHINKNEGNSTNIFTDCAPFSLPEFNNLDRYVEHIVNMKDLHGRTPLHYSHLDTAKFLIERGANVQVADIYGQTALHSAVERCDLDTVKFLAENGADVQVASKSGTTTLHEAVARCNLEIIKFLVKRGACIFKKDVYGSTVLHIAAQRGHLDTVKFLVKRGADVNATENYGTTAMHQAIRSGHLATVKFLVQHGANAQLATLNGRSPLYLAAINGNLDIVKFLVACGTDVNVNGVDGYTALHIAAGRGHQDTVRFLTESGADVNVATNNGRTSLHLAAMAGHLDTVKYLVERGAGICERDQDGCTPLHIAARRGKLNTVESLVECGAPINVGNKDGSTVLHEAVKSGHFNTVKFLVQRGANIETMTNNGRTALYYAAMIGHVGIAKFLVESGADVNTGSSDGYTALHTAAERGQLATVKFLVQSGAKIQKTTENGRTALFLSAMTGHLNTAKFLVERGATINKRDRGGCTAFHIAAITCHLDVARFLVERGADINVRDEDGNAALHIAVRKGPFDIVQFLVECGVDVNIRDDDGCTALHEAVRSGLLDTVKFLVDNGADVSMKSNDGYTVLSAAGDRGHREIVRFLEKRSADNTGIWSIRSAFSKICR